MGVPRSQEWGCNHGLWPLQMEWDGRSDEVLRPAILPFAVDVSEGFCTASWADNLDTTPLLETLPMSVSERMFITNILHLGELQQYHRSQQIAVPSLQSSRIRAAPDIGTRFSHMAIGNHDMPAEWNGIHPKHTVFNYVKAARDAIASNPNSPYQWVKVAWQTTNAVALVVQDLALHTFIVYARTYDLTRPRVYTIEDAVVHWDRYLRFGAVPMTSVRAFTLFKYAIKVTGAAPSFAAMYAPYAPIGTFDAHRRHFYDCAHENDAQVVALNISNAYVYSASAPTVHGAIDYTSEFNCTTWRNADRDEYDRLFGNDNCTEAYATALQTVANTDGHFVCAVRHARDGAYAVTGKGVLTFYGKPLAELPMYMLFLMILGAAGSLGAIIDLLQQGGQLDRAFGRPLASAELAWLAESLRSLQHARHSLYTLAGLLRPNTTTGGYNDYMPAALYAATLRLINGIADVHSSNLPERPAAAAAPPRDVPIDVPAEFFDDPTASVAAESTNPVFTLDASGAAITFDLASRTPLTEITMRSVLEAGRTYNLHHVHALDAVSDGDGNPVSVTFIAVGVKADMDESGTFHDHPADVQNVFQVCLALSVHGTQHMYFGESSNVQIAIENACRTALKDARERYPVPIQPIVQLYVTPSVASVKYPVLARCASTLRGVPNYLGAGRNLAIVFDNKQSEFVVYPNVIDPVPVATHHLDNWYDRIQQYRPNELAVARAKRRGAFGVGTMQGSDGTFNPTLLSGGHAITGPVDHEHNFASISWKRVRQHGNYQNLAVLDPHGRWHVFYNIIGPAEYYKELIHAHETAHESSVAKFASRVQCGSLTGADFCTGCPAIYWTERSATLDYYRQPQRRSPVPVHRHDTVNTPVAGPAGAPNVLRNPNTNTGRQRPHAARQPGPRQRPAHQVRSRHARHRSFKSRAGATAATRDVTYCGNVQTAAFTVLAMMSVFAFATQMMCGYAVAGALAIAVLLASAYPVHQSLQSNTERQTYAVTDSVANRWLAGLCSPRTSPPVTVNAVARRLSQRELRRQRPARARRLHQRLATAGRFIVVPDSDPTSSRAVRWLFACLAALALVTVWATNNSTLYHARHTGSVGASSVRTNVFDWVGAWPGFQLGGSFSPWGGYSVTTTSTSPTCAPTSEPSQLPSNDASPAPGTTEHFLLHGSHTPTTDEQLCNTALPAQLFGNESSTFSPPSCSTLSRPFAVHAYDTELTNTFYKTDSRRPGHFPDSMHPHLERVHLNKQGEPVDLDWHQDAGDFVYFTNDSAAEAPITPYITDLYEITSRESIKVTGYNGDFSHSIGRGTIRYRYMVENGTWHTRDIHNVTVMPCAKQRLFGQAHDNDSGFRQLDAIRYNDTPEGRQPVVRFRNLMKFAGVIVHKDRESLVPQGALKHWEQRSVPHLHKMDEIRRSEPSVMHDTDPTLLCNLFTKSNTDVDNTKKQNSLLAARDAAVERIPFPLMHARLCYCDVRFLKKMGRRVPAGYKAADAIRAKMSRTNTSTIHRTKATTAGATVYMDIAGPFPPSLGTPYKYVIGFTDSATGRSWAYPMRKKSDSTSRLQQFILDLRTYGVTMQTLMTDNDSVFRTPEFTSVCDNHSVHRRYSAPECQWQNGPAESFVSRCKHLGSAALAGIRVSTDVRDKYTIHAMLHAAHASNFIAKESGVSPVQGFAKLTNTLPTSMHDLRTFGSKCWVYDSAHKGLAPRALEARVLGCATACGVGEYDSDTWLVHILSTNALRISRHVVFDESGADLSAEQLAHQALLITTWTEQFKLKGPPNTADVACDNNPDSAFTAHDEPDLGDSPYHTILATKGSNPGPAADAVRYTDGTILLGPNIERAPSYIKLRCINRVGTKVDTTMGTSFVSKHGNNARYTRTDLGYDLVNHYLVVAVPAHGQGVDDVPVPHPTVPVPHPPARAAPRVPAIAAHLHPMQGMFTVQVPQSVSDIAEIFGISAQDVISHATNHRTQGGQQMKLTAGTRFTPGADIRIPINAVVPADVTLTQVPAPPPVGPVVSAVSAPDTVFIGPAVGGLSFDVHDRDKWLLNDDDRLSIAALRYQYSGSADVYLEVDDEMYLFRKKSHAPFSLNAFSMPTDDMPSVKGALKGPHRDKWLAAIEAEYNSLDEHNTWVLVPQPKHARAIDVKLVLKRKRDRHGEITKYKARLVLRGDQCESYDALTQLYTPVACIPSFRLMCSIAAEHDYELNSLDFTTAFLNADCNTTVYAKQASYREVKLDDNGVPMVYRMRKSCYGLPFAPKLWHDMLHNWMTKYGFVRSVHDPCVYTLGKVVILVYVDDLSALFPTSEQHAFDKFLADLAKKFKYTGGGPIDHFLGYGITRDRKARTLKIDQYAFIDTMLKEHATHDAGSDADVDVHIPHKPDVRLGIQLCPGDDAEGLKEKAIMKTKPFREVVGSLLWLMRGTRPDLAYVVGMLGRVMHNPGLAHWAAATQALGYVRTTRLLALTYSRSGVPMDCSVDADWLPNYGTEFDNWKSTSGYHVNNANAAVTWRSKRQDVIATSTPHAECLAAYEVIRDVILMRGLKADMGHEEPHPTVLQEDNQTLVRTSLNESGTDRIKHWDYKVHWIRQCVADGIVTFAWVNSADQMSDTATKPLPRPAFERQRDHNMGITKASFKVHTEIFRENAHKFPDVNAAVNSLDLATTCPSA